MDTINRLLKKQAPKRRGRMAEIMADGEDGEPEPERPSVVYTRYTQTVQGTAVAVPEEWLEAPIGSVFAGDVVKPQGAWGGRMVMEVS